MSNAFDDFIRYYSLPQIELPFRRTARQEQIRPDGNWRTWYLKGGRGSGKTWATSNNFAELILSSPPGEWAIVAPTYGDARDTCIESQESGLIKALGGKCGGDGHLIDVGEYISSWNRSIGHLVLNNGSLVYCDGGNDGALRIQGKNLRGAWVEELGLMLKWRTTWDESLRYAVRLDPAKIIANGTPKSTMPARKLIRRLLDDDNVPVSSMSTEDNKQNLSTEALKEFLELKGTRLERQELYGDLLEEVDGALWTLKMMDTIHITEIPRLVRIVVSVDPAASTSEDADETGIIVVGKGENGKGYVLDDQTVHRKTPAEWGQKVVDTYRRWEADRVITERNMGGDMVEHVIATIDSNIPTKGVTATRGKRLRAEPVAAAYEKQLVHHVGIFSELETQMLSFVQDPTLRDGSGESSPDRVDALVMGLTELGVTASGTKWSEMYTVKKVESQDKPPSTRGWGQMYNKNQP